LQPDRSTPTALLIVAIVALYLLTIRPGQGWFGDFAMYVSHAKNIVEARDYADTGYIRNPLYPHLSPQAYPPVFPLLLAPVYAAFGLNLAAMKVLVIVFFGLALWMIDRALKDRLGLGGRLVLLGMLGLNPCFWQFKDDIVSDIPFLFLTYLSLWSIHTNSTHPERTLRRQMCFGILTGLIMYLAFATRSVGLVLLPCVLAYEILRTRRIGVPIGVAAATMLAGVAVQNLLVGSTSQYLETLMIYLVPGAVGEIAPHVARAWPRGVAELWVNGHTMFAAWVVTAIASGLALVGYIAVIRRRWTVFEVFAPLYLLAVLPWPLAQDLRFLVPVVPLYLYYAIEGWRLLTGKLPARLNLAASIAICLVVAGIYVSRYATLNPGWKGPSVTDPSSDELFTFIRNYTDPSDTLVFAKPRVIALYTGRRCAATRPKDDDEPIPKFDKELLAFLAKINATHVIAAPWSQQAYMTLTPFVRRYPWLFEPLYRNEGFEVYRVHRGRLPGSVPRLRIDSALDA